MVDERTAVPAEPSEDDVVLVGVTTRESPPAPHPFATLPEPVAPEDMVTEHDTDPGPDPYGGRDTELDFLLRNALP